MKGKAIAGFLFYMLTQNWLKKNPEMIILPDSGNMNKDFNKLEV